MQIGMIGLGKMGMNMAVRLKKAGRYRVIGFARTKKTIHAARKKGIRAVNSIVEFANQLPKPRIVWLMVPAGEAVDQVISELIPHLSPNDVVIDGGNSFYQDSIRRGNQLSKHQLHFLDVGTSGGIWGLTLGYCLMVGGNRKIFQRVEPFLKALSFKNGYSYFGSSGAGHFVKMIHNGIEYGLMQSYAEGFALLKASPYDFDLRKISHLWNQGSVVRSWLLELAEDAFAKDPKLTQLKGYVEDSGEGRWTIGESLRFNVPAPVIALALYMRFTSRDPNSFSARFLAALRNEFGGHRVKKS